MFTICNVCGASESASSNGDCDYCTECYSIEQGFLHLDEWEHDCNLYVDEDGNIYNANDEHVGSEYVY